jgi:hypothetical protein
MKPFCETSTEVLDHINPAKPVYVYRNLQRKCLSVKQERSLKELSFCSMGSRTKKSTRAKAEKRPCVYCWSCKTGTRSG